MLSEAVAALATDGADPTTWVQALGGVGLISIGMAFLIWVVKIRMGQDKSTREDNTTLRKELADARKENDRLDDEVDKERERRRTAEDQAHTAVMENARLQQIIDGMRHDKK